MISGCSTIVLYKKIVLNFYKRPWQKETKKTGQQSTKT